MIISIEAQLIKSYKKKKIRLEREEKQYKSIIVRTVLSQSHCVTKISNVQSYLEKSILKPNKKFNIKSHMVIQGKHKTYRKIKISPYIYFFNKTAIQSKYAITGQQKMYRKFLFVKKIYIYVFLIFFSLVKYVCHNFLMVNLMIKNKPFLKINQKLHKKYESLITKY